MSPKFFGFLWILTAAAALGLTVAGMFTMLTLVVFGFIAFGLVFTGMMCVLPGVVSHPPAQQARVDKAPKQVRAKSGNRATMPAAIGLRTH